MAKKSVKAGHKFGDKRNRDTQSAATDQVARTTRTRGQRWARNFELAKYLNISEMTLWRWKNDPDQRGYNFPPAVRIDSMEFNDLDKVDDWMEARRISEQQSGK